MAKAQQSANGRATARPGKPGTGAGAGQAGRSGRTPPPAARSGSPGRNGSPARPGNSARATVRMGDTAPVLPRGRYPAADPGAPRAVPPPSRWVPWAAGLLALIGLGLSVYLTITHLHPAALVCSNKGLVNCTAVTTSAQSKVFGIFPVAELGLAFYVFMVAINMPWAWRTQRVFRLGPVSIGNQEIRWIRLASAILGIGFVLYLLYAELIQIGNICLFCTGVHITTFLLFVLILFDSVFRQAPPNTAATVSAKRTKG